MKDKRFEIWFEYCDSLSHGHWHQQHCSVVAIDEVDAVRECKSLYGLDDGDCEYCILEVIEV